jgi:hypothetical protein
MAAMADPQSALKACEQRVTRCEEALDKAFTALEAEREFATELERQNNRLQNLVAVQNEIIEDKSAWYRDPLFVGVLGVALGAFVGVKASAGH